MSEPTLETSWWVNLLAVPIAAGLLGALLAAKYFLDRRRLRALEALAEEWGWTFRERGEGLVPLPSYFLLSGKGVLQTEDLVARTLYGGSSDCEFFVFQHRRYRAGDRGRKRPHGYPHNVALVHCPNFNLPRFTIRRARFWRKVGSALGGKEVSFEDSPRFWTRYRVECDDPDAIRSWIGSEVREFLIGQGDLVVQGFANELLCYRPTRMWRPASFNALSARVLATETTQLVDLLRRSEDERGSG